MKFMQEFLRGVGGREKSFSAIGFFILAGALAAVPARAVDFDPVLLGKVALTNDAWKVVVRSNLAYVADDLSGLQVISISNPAAPVRLGGVVTPGAAIGLALGSGPTVNFAYVADGPDGVEVINIANPTNVFSVGTIGADFVQSANGVAVSPYFGSAQYLYIADDIFGLDIFRIVTGTTPNNLDSTNLTSGPLQLGGTAMGLHINRNNPSTVIVADGEGGLAVVDTTDKANPVFVNGADIPLPPLDGFARDVLLDGTFDLYAACTEPVTPGMVAASLSSGTVRGSYPTSGDAYGLVLTNNRMFMAAAKAGVVMLDVTAPSSPKRLGGFYTGDEAYGVAFAGTNLCVAAHGLQILNPYFPANPQRLGQYYPTNGRAIATVVAGNLAFVADANLDLQVLNVSNAASPKYLATFVTAATPNGIAIAGTNAFVAVGTAGLEVIDISNPTNLVTVGIADTPGFANDILVSGNYAYVADGPAGLTVLDISDPTNPQLVGTNDTPGYANGLAISNNLIFVADGAGGLVIYDVANSVQPVEIGSVLTGGTANGVALSGRYAFIADGDLGMSVVDVADPANPVLKAGFPVGDTANGIAISGNYAYLADGLSSLDVVDISDPLHPRRAGGNTAFDALSVTIYSNRVYVATGGDGVAILPFIQPIQFSNAVRVVTNTLHLWLNGPTNQPIRVQRGTNLTSWVDWQSLTLTNLNPLELVDTNFPANAKRFYRAVSP